MGLFAVISLLVVSFSSVYFLMNGRDVIDARLDSHLESILVLKEQQLNDFIEEESEDIENLLADSSFIGCLTENATFSCGEEVIDRIHARDLLIMNLRKDPDFIEFFILDLEGKVVLSTDESQENKVKQDRPYFKEGQKGLFVQNVYYSTSMQAPSLMIAAPINDINGEVIGVFAGRININQISKIMAEHSGLGRTGETYLVNKYNSLITDIRSASGSAFKKSIYTFAVKNCLQGQSGSGHYENSLGVTVHGAYKWIPKRDVCLIVEIDTSEALEPVQKLTKTIFLMSLVITLLAILLGFYFSRIITRPLSKLTAKVDEVSKGNFNVQLDHSNTGEIQSLTDSLNRVLASMKLAVLRTEEKSKKKELDEITKKK
ncbi:MAG: cache domain-containing protein [Nanoarchaeota archaeon]